MKPNAYSPRSKASPPQATAHGQRSTAFSTPAFTLVELMVVVAVIAALIMLLVPNIRSARDRAWSANCQNNLRQFAIALNQYLDDHGGYFVFRGQSHGSGDNLGHMPGWKDASGMSARSDRADGRMLHAAQIKGYVSSARWGSMIGPYFSNDVVTLDTLAAGVPSTRVCPVVLQQLLEHNYFDPTDPEYKGTRQYFHTRFQADMVIGDWENSAYEASYNDDGQVSRSNYLDASFTTYAINPEYIHSLKSKIPEQAVAFIDWNAREGWYATLAGQLPVELGDVAVSTNPVWMFSNPKKNIVQGQEKWSDDWWKTEVGFHHRVGNAFGANYVAMDGHLGWISSNAISRTNFTGVTNF